MLGKSLGWVPLVAVAVISLFVTASAPASAKGPIDMIALTDAAGHVVEVTSGPALLTFSPWGIQFVDGELPDTPEVGKGYRADLFLGSGDGSMKRIYTFMYYPTSSAGPVIYLPGSGDPDYRMNISTILSSDGSWHNGKWHRASAEWVSFAASLVRVTPPTTGDGGLR